MIGTLDTVKTQLRQLANDAKVDGLMTVNMITDHEAQPASWRLLAEAVDLTA